MERDHAPVHDIGAIALCRIFFGDVRKAADHSLAGSRLLTCGAVTGLIRIDHGTDLDILYVDILGTGDRADDFIDGSQRGILLSCVAAGNTEALGLVNSLGAADILGITTGQSELSKSKRVGPVG